MATIAKKEKSGFTIGVSCPGCGGELELEDNFFTLECDHCGSAIRLLMPEAPPTFVADVKTTKREARFAIDRYLKKNDQPLTNSGYQLKKLYYPYWKVDAILFRVRKGMEKRVVYSDNFEENEISYDKEKTDISLSPYTTTLTAGINFDGLPDSLGLRSEYIKLFPLSDEKMEEDFDLLPIIKPWDEIRESLFEHVGAISSFDSNLFGVNKTDIYCPKAMLLYFPFFIFDFYDTDGFNRFVIDGVTGKVINHITTLNLEASDSYENRHLKLGEISIIPHRCNNCGEDLPPEESLVYICRNCQVITDLEPGVAIESIQQVTHKDGKHDIFVPFWAFTIKGVNEALLKSIFGGIYRSDKVVIPAFKVQNYNALFKLSKRMSAAFPQLNFETLTKMNKLYTPVNLPLNEAVALTELFITKDQFNKNISYKNLPKKFQFDEISLFYAPFHLESYFYVDSVLQAVTFEKNLI